MSDGQIANPIDHSEFLKEYEEYYTTVLAPSEDRLKTLLRSWRTPSHWAKYSDSSRRPIPSPIQRTRTRIKRPESVVDKILRKPDSYPDGLTAASVRRMNDTLGGRVIVHFMSNLALIDGEIRRCEDLDISPDNPPTAYFDGRRAARLGLDRLQRLDKDSGYTSLHYIVRFRSGVGERPWLELQLRTMAEDLWAEVEHVLGYKPDKPTSPTVKGMFRIISDQLASLDEHFNLIYADLTHVQNTVQIANADRLTTENIAAVLSEHALACSQNEVDGLLKLLFSRGVKTVADCRRIAQQRRIESIEHVYQSEKGRPPTNFEIVAALGTLAASVRAEDEPQLVRAHISYLDAWDSLKKP